MRNAASATILFSVGSELDLGRWMISCPRSFLSALSGTLNRFLGRCRRCRSRGANDEVEQEACGSQHQRQEKYRRHQPRTDPTFLAVEINPTANEDVKGEKVSPRDGCAGWRTQERLNAAERRSRNGRPNRAQSRKHEPGIQDGGRSAHQGGSNEPRSPPPTRQENHQGPDWQDQQITGAEKQVHMSPFTDVYGYIQSRIGRPIGWFGMSLLLSF